MIKTTLLASSFAALLSASAAAQAEDVGLYLDGGVLTVVYGQECGPVGCTPFTGGGVTGGETRNLFLYGAPQTLFAVAIGMPGACVALPGFDNALLLADPVVFAFGLTSAPPFVPLPCQQGIANASFTLPVGVPAGITFRLQSLGQSNSGRFAFGPTVEAVTF